MSPDKDHPSAARLMQVLAATWPAAETLESDGWRLRRGDGGGQRVSAAVWAGQGAPGAAEIAEAGAAMRKWGQKPLFQVADDPDADAALHTAGFALRDTTVLYSAPSAALTGEAAHIAAAYRATFAPAILEGVWDAGGIGPSRRAVMARAAGPSVYLMSRVGDRPCAGAFLAVDGDIAMIHAIEVLPNYRRHGAARLLIEAGARFAVDHGASWMSLAVTEANAPARALYEKLGMTAVATYHYRVEKDD
ncbi:MAG: GNAT family N-acetyltransferase [Pseudomonadota bacterium]